MLWLLFLHVTTEHLQVDVCALEALKEKKIMCMFPLMFIQKFIWNSIVMFVLFVKI